MAFLADNFDQCRVLVPRVSRPMNRRPALRRSSWFHGLALLVLSFALGLAAFGATLAPPQNEAEVKADYLFLFTKYVEWPPGSLAASNQPIVIGVIGDEAVGAALERRVEGRITQGGRKVTILRARQPADVSGCQVIFMGVGERSRLPKITEAVGGKPVLTVCDTEGLFNQGAMIKFVLTEGAVRFEVKLEPVERVGLSIQSGMLGSAKRVWRKARTSLEPP